MGFRFQIVDLGLSAAGVVHGCTRVLRTRDRPGASGRGTWKRDARGCEYGRGYGRFERMEGLGEKWGLFGGSFDPPHVGHLMAAIAAMVRGAFDRLIVVPCRRHAFGKEMASFEHRVAMARVAFDRVNGVEVSEIESRLPAPNRTLETLRALRVEHPSVRWALVVGADVLAQREHWFRFDDLAAEADVLAVGRSGYVGGVTPQVPDVNSTLLRAILAEGGDTMGWLDPRIEAYIRSHGLYGTSGAD